MKTYKHIWLIYMASGISIIILISSGLLFMQKSRNQVKYIDAVEHTYKVLSALNFCEKKLIDAESSQRGYLLTGNNDYKILFEHSLPLVDSSLKKIGALTSDNVSQKTYFLQLTKFITNRVIILRRNLSLKKGDPLFIKNLNEGTIAMDNCRDYMLKMSVAEESLLKTRIELKNKYQRLNLSSFKATLITACLICIVAICIFFRELNVRLTAQKNLKAKIRDLSNSNKELEEITFAASHDLQEPLRKVSILSSLFAKKIAGKIPEAELEIVFRVNKIIEQMHVLLNDLVLYTNLLNPHEKYTAVNLYDVFVKAYSSVFKNEPVQLNVSGKFPLIQGSATQLETMAYHLLDNCSKFRAQDRELLLTLSYELKRVKDVKHFWEFPASKYYHQITIKDNGIGFDSEYNDKIFGLFQRLHSEGTYAGKGIGLSICRRIMINHKGYISVMGKKMEGAVFILNFPVLD